MRISSTQIFNLATQSMADTNQAISKTQEQLSTGRRVLSAADDPVAATRIQQITSELNAIDQYKKNITLAENSLTLTESTLNAITNNLRRLEELAIQAGNTATLSEGDYRALVSEVELRLDELLDMLNTRNVNGDYIFAGYKSGSPAFVGDISSGFQFAGDEGQFKIQVDTNTTIAASDSGKNIFVDVPSENNTVTTSTNPNNRSIPPVEITVGEIVDQVAYDNFYPEDIVITFNEDSAIVPNGKNFTVTERSSGKIIAANVNYVDGEELTYNGVSFRMTGNPASEDSVAGLNGDQLFINSSNKQDVLNTVLRFRNAMSNYDGNSTSRDNLESVVASTIANLSNAQNTILDTVTTIGARNNTLQSTTELHLDTEIVSKKILSDLQDLDYAEAASRLSMQTMILQAAQASFLRISELNLFNRL